MPAAVRSMASISGKLSVYTVSFYGVLTVDEVVKLRYCATESYMLTVRCVRMLI